MSKKKSSNKQADTSRAPAENQTSNTPSTEQEEDRYTASERAADFKKYAQLKNKK